MSRFRSYPVPSEDLGSSSLNPHDLKWVILRNLQTLEYNGYLGAFLFLTFTLAIIGLFNFSKFVLKTVVVFLETFILPGKSLKTFGAGKGAWAVVTGASGGIGEEFAVQLAKAGFNIILVGRSERKLADIQEKTTKYGVDTRILLIDFSEHDQRGYDDLASLCKDLNVGILVNNVGKSHVMPTYFVDTPLDEMDDILTININATLHVTKAILPGMIQRKCGLILNMGSFAGEFGSPMLATYSGSKAFLSTFTDALGDELKAHNIIVEHINTYFVVSNMSKVRRPSALIPLPAPFVGTVLSKVGLACGAAFTGRPGTSTPFWSHSLLDYGMGVIAWKQAFITYTHGLHVDIRKRALRKAERAAKRE